MYNFTFLDANSSCNISLKVENIEKSNIVVVFNFYFSYLIQIILAIFLLQGLFNTFIAWII